MSKIALEGNASGTGTFTIASPNSNSNYTLTLPTSTGTVVVTGGAQTIEFAAGTAAAPSITFTGDTNTGIFSPGADSIGFAEGGAESMRIDSSGNVGIGTTSPATPLHVRGANNEILRLQSSDATTGSLYLSYVDSAGTEKGYVGYGSSISNDFIISNALSGDTRFNTNGTERMRIDSGGNVGIGTSSPLSASNYVFVTVQGGSSGGGYIQYNSSGSRIGQFTQDSTTAYLGNFSNNPLVFQTNNTERARITSGGNFLIGNTDGTGLLTVGSSKLAAGNQQNAITSGTTGSWFAGNSSGGSCNMQADYISSAGTAVLSTDSGTTNGFYFRTYTSGSYDYRFRIAASGSATNSTGSYGTISDARTKTVVGNASSQWDDIKQLNFIKYKLNKQVELEQSEENKDGYVAPVMLGLVAQEVEQICPGLIEESADPEFDQVKVIKTSILYMKAVKALQEAMTRIEALEAEVAALKGQ